MGMGSFSNVYYGELQRHGGEVDVVAVKFSRKITGLSSMLASHEAKVLSMLSHRNINRYFGVMEDECIPECGLVLEFVEAELVEYALCNQALLPDIVRQMLNGVQHIHSSCIIHGDISPGNIRVKTNGIIVITDFGLSRFDGQPPSCSTVHGLNPRYVAPEVLELADEMFRPTKSSDIYSLGMIILQTFSVRYSSVANTNDAGNTARDLSLPFNQFPPRTLSASLFYHLLSGNTPRLDDYEDVRDNIPLRIVLERCWTKESDRPSIGDLLGMWEVIYPRVEER
ncbi:kinase-like protein [Coprinopsis marcescibilis]|uniref:non-specific serine/threonine protein kinase n=1 Tax=Coprinopsis marcescibilis TaxID=230819 RepID=A0A5C3KF60_COPMA|nr:kinase-like protein [Coprinopsis marcescibilis]